MTAPITRRHTHYITQINSLENFFYECVIDYITQINSRENVLCGMSFSSHALNILSADDLGEFSRIL